MPVGWTVQSSRSTSTPSSRARERLHVFPAARRRRRDDRIRALREITPARARQRGVERRQPVTLRRALLGGPRGSGGRRTRLSTDMHRLSRHRGPGTSIECSRWRAPGSSASAEAIVAGRCLLRFGLVEAEVATLRVLVTSRWHERSWVQYERTRQKSPATRHAGRPGARARVGGARPRT